MYPEYLLLSLEAGFFPPQKCSISLQCQALGGAMMGQGLVSFLWVSLASSEPRDFSTPLTVPILLPDVPWNCAAATKDSSALIPQRVNIL